MTSSTQPSVDKCFSTTLITLQYLTVCSVACVDECHNIRPVHKIKKTTSTDLAIGDLYDVHNLHVEKK